MQDDDLMSPVPEAPVIMRGMARERRECAASGQSRAKGVDAAFRRHQHASGNVLSLPCCGADPMIAAEFRNHLRTACLPG